MEDFPTRLADLLESVATKVRSMTIDRAEKAVKIGALALPTVVLGVLALIFLFLTILGALEVPLGQAGALAVLAGLSVIVGLFLWTKRRPSPKRET